MTINFSFSVVLLIAGILIGLLATIILLLEKANKHSNKFLAALLMVCVGTLFHNFLIEANIYQQQPQLYFLPVLLSLGIGPLLYLYVTTLINSTKITTPKLVLHLLPMLVQLGVYTYCFVQNGNEKYNLYINVYEPYINPLQTIAVYISVAVYLFLSFKKMAAYKIQLNNFYSNSNKIALQWLKTLLYIFMGYYILSILFIVVAASFKIQANYFPSDFIRCIIIFIIAYFAVKQNSLIGIQQNIKSIEEEPILPPTLADEIIVPITEIEAPKIIVENEELPKPKEINAQLLQKIIDVVENEQLYLNEELTIADVATKLGYSTKSISATINNGLGKSFSLFINEYRINLFKQKRASGKYNHLSIMGLAYDCGFNSKSTFNRIFKEITGSIPKTQNTTVEEVPN